MQAKSNCKNYLWVIGGGMLQVPLIEEANKLNLKTIVTDGSSDCVAKPLADIFAKVDIYDVKSHLKFYDTDIAKLDINIVGVLAAGIDAHETMACVAQHLNLPGINPAISSLVSNKDLFRESMVENHFDVPKFKVLTLDNLSTLEDISQYIGFPLIIKNTSSSGSRGTKIFYKPDFVGMKQIALEAISVSRSKKALIESFWDGTEHTLETLFDADGNFHRCFITDRTFDKSQGYALETGLVHPSQLSLEEQEKIYVLGEKVARAVGVNIGAAKFDIIYTQSGPKVIEMTVRLSGGFDAQYLVPAATGKNILKAAILTAQGEIFDARLLADSKGRVALSESISPNPGTILDISGLEKAINLPGFEHIFFRYGVGDIVEPFTDCTKRVCFIIASGHTLLEAKNNMLAIKEAVNIVIKQDQ